MNIGEALLPVPPTLNDDGGDDDGDDDDDDDEGGSLPPVEGGIGLWRGGLPSCGQGEHGTLGRGGKPGTPGGREEGLSPPILEGSLGPSATYSGSAKQ